MSAPGSITRLLERTRAGEAAARDELLRLTYDELRSLARALLESERPDHTFTATDLVHEAFLRILKGQELRCENRAQFRGFLAQAMRHVLVSHARARDRAKRGGGEPTVSLDETLTAVPGADPDLIALDEALDRLAKVDQRRARVVELRFFGGMKVPEVAEVLKVSTRTVKSDWVIAKLWLMHQIRKGDSHGR